MVKNMIGGSKHKSYARKGASNSGRSQLRLSTDPAEKYAHVTKMYGDMCDVICDDNISRKCFIRGKFRGKGKRNSIINIGSIILIGTREWASDNTKCDLLEVYGESEISQLKNHPKVPTEFLSLIISGSSRTSVLAADSDVFEFTNSVVIPSNDIILPFTSEKSSVIDENGKFILDETDEINIDDI